MAGKWFNTDLTWERDNIVLKRGKVSTRVLKSDKQFRDHRKYAKYRTKCEQKCMNSIKGVFTPKISNEEDVKLTESIKAICKKLCLTTSDLQNSYISMLRGVTLQNKQREAKTQENLYLSMYGNDDNNRKRVGSRQTEKREGEIDV